MSHPPLSDRLQLLREGPVMLFIASRFCSGAALTLLRATVAWQVYELSQSAFFLGLVGLIQFLPAIPFGLLGGAVADNQDRRRIVIVMQVSAAACAALLWWATARDLVQLALIFGTILVVAISAAFENPARSALLPQLVTRAQFPQAVSWFTAVAMLGFMTGPVLMGFAIDRAGVASAYVLYLVLQAVSILLLLAVRVRRRLRESDRRPVSLHSIREGLRFVWKQPVVLGCMTLDMFAVLFGGAVALLPIYANDILEVGPRGYGLLASSLEIGSVLMAVVLISAPPVKKTGQALLWSVVAFGCATVVFGLSRSFPLSLGAYMAAGAADYVSAVMRGTAIQLSTPDEYRGRVSSVNYLFIGASNQLGAAESGFLAAVTSPTFSVTSGGLGAVLVALLVAWKLPPLRRYQAHGT